MFLDVSSPFLQHWLQQAASTTELKRDFVFGNEYDELAERPANGD